MGHTLVSIIIPVYNSAQYLEATIHSAIDQTWQPTEIIIVDDGSIDNSLEIARSFERENIRVFTQTNKGGAAARNKGLIEAKGDYIQFLDADDLLSPDKIESQIACLNNSFTHLSICHTFHFNDGRDHLNGVQSNDWYRGGNYEPVDFLIKLYAGEDVLPGFGGMVTIHSWLTPRLIIEKAGLWNEKLSLDDDGEFFCRVVLASNGVVFSEKGANYYRKFSSQQSLSAQKTNKGVKSAILAIDLKREHLKAKTNDEVVDRIFAKHYWWAGVLAYPQFKDISDYSIKKAKELNYRGEKYVGGPAGHFLTKFLGWKAARLLAYYQQAFKKLWA